MAENQQAGSVSGFKAQPIIRKYTMEEFWQSLSYCTYDADDDYDGFLHIQSNINGSEIKIAIAHIIHEASKYQSKM